MVRDYLLGFMFAIALFTLLAAPSCGGAARTIATAAAASSYTIYVVHLPVIVFLRAWLVPGAPWLPTPAHIGWSALILVAVVAYSWAIARLAEARTPLVRNWLLARCPSLRRPPQYGRPAESTVDRPVRAVA
jgi:peptidoglycan/LPS O-acetylase OafA/YrhL